MTDLREEAVGEGHTDDSACLTVAAVPFRLHRTVIATMGTWWVIADVVIDIVEGEQVGGTLAPSVKVGLGAFRNGDLRRRLHDQRTR